MTTNKTVLIVEDDGDILMTVQELLESEGYSTRIAGNGSLALTQLQAATLLPDLILIDYMMPVMDAAAFRAEQLKDARLARIPVLLMTADAHPDVKQLRIGALGYIKKPLDLEKFLRMVKESCG